MRTNFSASVYLLMTVALILSACNLPINDASGENPAVTESFTVIAEAAASPTDVVFTDTPTVASTETALSKPTMTATPEPPLAEVIRETNCRIGPAGNYDLVAKYEVGQILDVAAKDLGAGYWFVRNPDKPEEECYLLAQNIKISG